MKGMIDSTDFKLNNQSGRVNGCVKCGGSYYEHDSYFNEYVCVNCGWSTKVVPKGMDNLKQKDSAQQTESRQKTSEKVQRPDCIRMYFDVDKIDVGQIINTQLLRLQAANPNAFEKLSTMIQKEGLEPATQCFPSYDGSEEILLRISFGIVWKGRLGLLLTTRAIHANSRPCSLKNNLFQGQDYWDHVRWSDIRTCGDQSTSDIYINNKIFASGDGCSDMLSGLINSVVNLLRVQGEPIHKHGGDEEGSFTTSVSYEIVEVKNLQELTHHISSEGTIAIVCLYYKDGENRFVNKMQWDALYELSALHRYSRELRLICANIVEATDIWEAFGEKIQVGDPVFMGEIVSPSFVVFVNGVPVQKSDDYYDFNPESKTTELSALGVVHKISDYYDLDSTPDIKGTRAELTFNYLDEVLHARRSLLSAPPVVFKKEAPSVSARVASSTMKWVFNGILLGVLFFCYKSCSR